MKLIICEKNSQAKAVEKALKNIEDKYIVKHAIGHLFERKRK